MHADIHKAPVFARDKNGRPSSQHYLDSVSTPSSDTSSATQQMSQCEPEETTRRRARSTRRQTGLGGAAPLADRLRPSILGDFVGQMHLTGPDTLLFSADGELSTENIIFWGPPG